MHDKAPIQFPKTPTKSDIIIDFADKNGPLPNSKADATKHIGTCKWCKDWKELTYVRNAFGDKVGVCENCLNHRNVNRRRAN